MALFGLYLMMAVFQIFLPIPMADNWPTNVTWETIRSSFRGINLIPFYYGTMFESGLNPRIIIWEIGGNILLTVPFGFGVGFLSNYHGKRLLWLALKVGLAIEGTQLLIRLVMGYYYHAVDINDVLLNGLGVLVGYGLFRAVSWLRFSQKGAIH